MSSWELSKKDFQEGWIGVALLSSPDPPCPKASVSTTVNSCQKPRLDALNKENDILYQNLCDIWKRRPIYEMPGECCIWQVQNLCKKSQRLQPLAKRQGNDGHIVHFLGKHPLVGFCLMPHTFWILRIFIFSVFWFFLFSSKHFCELHCFCPLLVL